MGFHAPAWREWRNSININLWESLTSCHLLLMENQVIEKSVTARWMIILSLVSWGDHLNIRQIYLLDSRLCWHLPQRSFIIFIYILWRIIQGLGYMQHHLFPWPLLSWVGNTIYLLKRRMKTTGLSYESVQTNYPSSRQPHGIISMPGIKGTHLFPETRPSLMICWWIRKP